jgi:hypothetical protein
MSSDLFPNPACDNNLTVIQRLADGYVGDPILFWFGWFQLFKKQQQQQQTIR